MGRVRTLFICAAWKAAFSYSAVKWAWYQQTHGKQAGSHPDKLSNTGSWGQNSPKWQPQKPKGKRLQERVNRSEM